MLPRKFNAVMAILVLFEQFLKQILFNIFAPNSESFTKHESCCSHFFHSGVRDMRVINCYQKVQNYEKIVGYLSKIWLKMAGGRGNVSPYSPRPVLVIPYDSKIQCKLTLANSER